MGLIIDVIYLARRIYRYPKASATQILCRISYSYTVTEGM